MLTVTIISLYWLRLPAVWAGDRSQIHFHIHSVPVKNSDRRLYLFWQHFAEHCKNYLSATFVNCNALRHAQI